MTYSLPAGLEAFAKCPCPGCPVEVYGPRNTENRCRAHGGQPAYERADDEYGLPLGRPDGPSSPSGLLPPSECE